MIKKIIFDVDNTLITFPKDYEEKYKSVIDKFNLKITAKELYDAIGKYELDSKNKYYTETDLLNKINQELNLELNLDFLEAFFDMYKNYITPISNDVKQTLEYLSDKYELVILSNWFTKSQESRLKEAGILEYFSEVYGTDKVPMKPNKECFLAVIKDLEPRECLMVGDNLDLDIKVPFELGMNVYHLNKFGTSKYPTINKIESLKELL